MSPPTVPTVDEHAGTAERVTLAITIVAAFIVVVDNTVLNVSIPTILRDFDTSLPTLEWVVTGYALTFATLLIIGGRLGDIYGHRRIFMIGTALFGLGSLVAALSQNVGQLILGEAVIEGIGASLMLPATLAILSSTFQGHRRASAFAAWGATAGVGSALGPVLGGFLTTNYSWRWSFGINVIIAPLAFLGAYLFMKPTPRSERRIKVDWPGAAMIAVGMFLLVFALSEGARYGWWRPLEDFAIGGHVIWPATRSISIIPVLFVIAVAILYGFYALERWKERTGRDPLFEFHHLRLPTYRYGLLTGLILSMGMLGMVFVLPQFLQIAKHLTAEENGFWMLPVGLCVIFGARLGSRLIGHYGTTVIVRVGLVSYALGILLIMQAVSLDITVWRLLPAFFFYGIGIGFAGAQLTNVVLSQIPAESTGVASGANTTVRQVGSALGVAVIGALLTTQTIRHATRSIDSSSMPADVKAHALDGIHSLGANYVPPASTSAKDASIIEHALQHGITTGTRIAMLFAFAVVSIGAIVSFLVPNVGGREVQAMIDDVDPELGMPVEEPLPSAAH
jgi:EmrB/QacA subfamily drug resistance transporter